MWGQTWTKEIAFCESTTQCARLVTRSEIRLSSGHYDSAVRCPDPTLLAVCLLNVSKDGGDSIWHFYSFTLTPKQAATG
jgi:hypothetical protein